MFLVIQDAAHKRVLVLNIPVVHVCVDRHSRSSADQQFRAQGSAHRTYPSVLGCLWAVNISKRVTLFCLTSVVLLSKTWLTLMLNNGVVYFLPFVCDRVHCVLITRLSGHSSAHRFSSSERADWHAQSQSSCS